MVILEDGEVLAPYSFCTMRSVRKPKRLGLNRNSMADWHGGPMCLRWYGPTQANALDYFLSLAPTIGYNAAHVCGSCWAILDDLQAPFGSSSDWRGFLLLRRSSLMKVKSLPRSSRLFAGAVVIGQLASQLVSAAVITVPSDLVPGNEYRLAFMTSRWTVATSANIADYNAFVTSAANSSPALAALGTSWHVIGSTATVDARDNTNTNPSLSVGVPIYNLAGARIANDNSDLWDGTIIAPLTVDEFGSTTPRTFILSGTSPDGSAYPFFELGHPGFVVLGDWGRTDNYWIWGVAEEGDDLQPVFGLSDVLSVVPEPSSITLGALAISGALLAASRRRFV
jgi:hypothetical protein